MKRAPHYRTQRLQRTAFENLPELLTQNPSDDEAPVQFLTGDQVMQRLNDELRQPRATATSSVADPNGEDSR